MRHFSLYLALPSPSSERRRSEEEAHIQSSSPSLSLSRARARNTKRWGEKEEEENSRQRATASPPRPPRAAPSSGPLPAGRPDSERGRAWPGRRRSTNTRAWRPHWSSSPERSGSSGERSVAARGRLGSRSSPLRPFAIDRRRRRLLACLRSRRPPVRLLLSLFASCQERGSCLSPEPIGRAKSRLSSRQRGEKEREMEGELSLSRSNL